MTITILPACRGKVTPVDSTEAEAGTTLLHETGVSGKIMRAWRTECDPTREQRAMLARYFDATRWVWNHALWIHSDRRGRGLKFASAYDVSKEFTAALNEDSSLAWMREPPRQTLDYVFEDLHLAFKAFFKRVKMAKKNPEFAAMCRRQNPNNPFGFPQFHSNTGTPRCRFRSVRYSTGDGVMLPKLDWMRVKERWYLPALPKAQISFASISLNAGRYWLSLTGETDRPEAYTVGGGAIVVAYNTESRALLVNGEAVEVPSKTQHEERHIKLLQRRTSRRKEGSGGYHEARQLRQMWERRVADRRYQFLHNLSSRIVADNQEITVMRPAIKDMVMNAEKPETVDVLALAMGEFFRQLHYKSDWYGRSYVEVGCGDADFEG